VAEEADQRAADDPTIEVAVEEVEEVVKEEEEEVGEEGLGAVGEVMVVVLKADDRRRVVVVYIMLVAPTGLQHQHRLPHRKYTITRTVLSIKTTSTTLSQKCIYSLPLFIIKLTRGLCNNTNCFKGTSALAKHSWLAVPSVVGSLVAICWMYSCSPSCCGSCYQHETRRRISARPIWIARTGRPHHRSLCLISSLVVMSADCVLRRHHRVTGDSLSSLGIVIVLQPQMPKRLRQRVKRKL
jgi:hypothetical protein